MYTRGAAVDRKLYENSNGARNSSLNSMRSLTWVRNVGPRCLGKKKITKITVGVVTRLTLKRQSERQREREVLISTHLLGRLRHKVLMTTNNSNYFKLILSDVSN